MASKLDPRALAGTVVACGIFGAAAYLGTGWFLRLGDADGPKPWLEPAPVTFSASILQEPDDFVADLHAAAQLARERWSYAEHRAQLEGVDIDALEAEALAELGDSPDAMRFHRALTRFVSGLHDGHASVFHSEPILPGSRRWPFHLVEVAEGVLVHGVADDLEGIESGDLLLAVDGRPVEACIADAQQSVFASTALARRRKAITFLCRWDDAAARRFRVRKADGSEAVVPVELPRSFEVVPAPTRIANGRAHRMLDGGIGYFRPGDFSPPPDSGWPGPPEGRDAILAETYAEFDRICGELGDARAVIVDLRGNPGGTDLLGQFLADRLIDGEYVYFQLSALGAGGWLEAHPLRSSATAGEHSLAGRPLAVIVDSATFSTADNVAACLRDVHPDVRFVGRPNGAGTGAPRPFTLPRTGTTIRFCTQRVRTPSGRICEGIPVAIDVPVTWTRDDLLAGRDPDLEAAIAALPPPPPR